MPHSKHRYVLRYAERLCLALILGNAGAFLLLYAGAAAPSGLRLPLLAGFALFFLLVLVALGHATPLARARRPKLSALDEPDGLSPSDFGAILTLAPRYQKFMAWAGLLALVAAAVSFGSVSWTSGLPFEKRHAMGIALYVHALASLLYPFLGALSRMPMALEDQVKLLQHDDV